MKLRNFLFISIIIVFNFKSFGQMKMVINGQGYTQNSALGVVAGVTGFKSNEVELGLGYNYIETRPRNKTFAKPFIGCSSSILLYPTNSELKGANFTAWASILFDFGITQSYYEKGDMKTWTTKPFVGLGIYGISFTYGYNFNLTNTKIEELSNNVFTMRYFLPIIGRKKTPIHKK